MANEQQVRAVIKTNRGGTYDSHFGPTKFDNVGIYEVWVQKDDVFHTRFIAEDRAGQLSYYDSFDQLCLKLAERFEDAKRELEALKHGRHVQNVILYVASAIFVVSALALTYLVLKGSEPNQTTFAVFASLIASGGGMFYGAWRSA